jgi:hypothetical chaperone protein
MNSRFVGIDFGTSNSAVSYDSPAGPKLVELLPGQFTIPSAIFAEADTGTYLFGKPAIEAYVSGVEGRLLRSLKSILGSSLFEGRTELHQGQVEFRELLERFLGYLKRRAEEELGGEIRSAVIGRPVCFVDDDPTRDALAQRQLAEVAQACGFTDIAFQYEPIAAGLDYEEGLKGEELALVADIGGGTADFSVIRLSPKRHLDADRSQDILANTGVHIGGTDFDRVLSLAAVMPHFGYRTRRKRRPELFMPNSPFVDAVTWHRIQMLYTRASVSQITDLYQGAQQPALLERLLNLAKERTGHRLATDVEAAKISLAGGAGARLEPDYIEPPLDVALESAVLESVSTDLCAGIRTSIRACIAAAGVSAEAIQTLLLTGGTTAIPFVRALCCAEVPEARTVEQDLFGSVALGLGVEARVRGRAASPGAGASL